MHVVIAKSDEEAAELATHYLQTPGGTSRLRLEVRGRVVYVWESASGPRRPNARRCTTAGTSDPRRGPPCPANPAATLRRRDDRRPLHLRGAARRHRERVRPRRCDDGRRRPRPARAGPLPRRPQGARARASTTPATWPPSPRWSPSTTCGSSSRSPISTRRSSPASARRSRRRSCSPRPPRCAARWGTSTSRTPSSRSTGSTARARGSPAEIPDDARFPLLVKVREGFGSRHIYRADDRRSARVPSCARRRSSRWCRSSAWARSSRSTSSATPRAAASTPSRAR